MSVTGFTELFLERGGKKDLEAIQIFRVFQVFTDTMEDGAYTVMNAPGLPIPGESLLPEDPTMWCTSLDPQPDVDGVTWKVKANYALKPPSSGTVSSPWNLDPVINFGFVSKSRPFDKCYAVGAGPIAPPVARGAPAVPVANSLGTPWDPPHMLNDFLLLIAISRNIKYSTFSSPDVEKYQNTINIDAGNITIAGIVVKQFEALCRDYKATKAWTGAGEAYVQETIEVILDPDTWLVKIVDQGILTGAVVGGYIELTPVKDSEGNAVNEPVLLDGNKQRNPAGADAVNILFHGYWEETWSGWLPTTF